MRLLPASVNQQSVRFRTTAGAVLALVTLLIVAGLTINWFVGRSLQQSSDSVLLEQATDRARLLGEGASLDLLIPPVGKEQIVAALAADGTVLASLGVPLETIALDVPLGVSTIQVRIIEPGEGPETEQMRAAVAEATDGVRVVVANEEESLKSARAAVSTVLLSVIPLTALAGALVAWRVTGRALEPVRRMGTELDEVVQAADGRRVTEPTTGDEIGELGTTINGVLDRLQAQSLAQRRFVADASHELKSPLANARAIIDTASATIDQAEYDRVTGSVTVELQRLHALVDDLLYLARGDEGPPRAPDTADLADLIFDECERVAATSPKRIDASQVAPIEAFVDPAEASRALRNLIENAERFAATVVTVSVQSSPGVSTVAVADDGPGVAPEDRASIFERFSRMDSDRARSAGGTGLGLSIVASIAERSRGTVLVVSSPSGGAQFELSFPTAEPSGDSAV